MEESAWCSVVTMPNWFSSPRTGGEEILPSLVLAKRMKTDGTSFFFKNQAGLFAIRIGNNREFKTRSIYGICETFCSASGAAGLLRADYENFLMLRREILEFEIHSLATVCIHSRSMFRTPSYGGDLIRSLFLSPSLCWYRVFLVEQDPNLCAA